MREHDAARPGGRAFSGWLGAWAVGAVLGACVLLAGCGDGEETPEAPPPDASKVAEAQAGCMTWYQRARAYTTAQGGRAPRDLVEVLPPPSGPVTEPEAPADPWGHAYEVWVDGETLHVRSWGPDGKPWTDDDILYPPL